MLRIYSPCWLINGERREALIDPSWTAMAFVYESYCRYFLVGRKNIQIHGGDDLHGVQSAAACVKYNPKFLRWRKTRDMN
ncbi:hypothetical protein AB8U03_13265 [Clostridium sp. Mt-5]|uniref:Uncharacterized protein n=1 Tax=Clostridium moutaii TaxID=3240932 RepID=A0ABV4BQT6_9CLOT